MYKLQKGAMQKYRILSPLLAPCLDLLSQLAVGSKEAIDALMILSHLMPVGWAPGTWEIAQAERPDP